MMKLSFLQVLCPNKTPRFFYGASDSWTLSLTALLLHSVGNRLDNCFFSYCAARTPLNPAEHHCMKCRDQAMMTSGKDIDLPLLSASLQEYILCSTWAVLVLLIFSPNWCFYVSYKTCLCLGSIYQMIILVTARTKGKKYYPQANHVF